MWQNSDTARSLTDAQRLDIKRSKIDIKIIKRDSSPAAKFDLFQRLNSFGSPLTAQETRSALLVATSPDFFEWLDEIATRPSFVACTALNERLIEERFDLELAVRFLVLHNRQPSQLSVGALRDLPQVLDDESIALAAEYPSSSESLARVFNSTFDTIAASGGEQIFRRWDDNRREFKGPFLVTSFEVFALGLGFHVANGNRYRKDLISVVQEFWQRPEMQGGFATGRSTEKRLSQFIPLGRELLRAE
jgi:hypothetical protein